MIAATPIDQQDPNTAVVKKAAAAPMTPVPATPTPLSIAPAPGSNVAGTIAGTSGGATGGLQPSSITPPSPVPIAPAPALAAPAVGASTAGVIAGASGGAAGGLQPSNAPAPTPMPITPAPALAAAPPVAPPVAAPISATNPQSIPIQGWGQSVANVGGDNGQIVGDSSGVNAPRTQTAVDAAAANDVARGGVPDERWAVLAQMQKAIAAGQALDPTTGAVISPNDPAHQIANDRVDPSTLPNNGIQTDQYAQNYTGAALHPNDPAYMASWNQARGTPGGIDPANPSGIPIAPPPGNATAALTQAQNAAQGGGSQATPFPTTLPSGPSATDIPIAGVPSAPITAGVNGPSLIDSTGAGDYTGKTIQPGASTDRFGIAKSRLDEFAKASDPYYQKSLRDATSQAAAGGRIGSGMLRTSLGDLAYNRDLQLDSAGKGFLNNALEGSIDDSYKNIGIAQQQQGFQSDQQKTAFDQAIRNEQLNEALRQGDFSRYYAILNAGEAGNPSDTALSLSNSYGNQASDAGQGAANLVGSAINADSQAKILASHGGGGSAVPSSGGGVPDLGGLPDWLVQYLEEQGVPAIQQTPNNAPYPGITIQQPPRPVGL